MSEIINTHLSIDWDFFFPNIHNYDLACKEAKIYFDTIWYARVQLQDELIPSGHKTFWGRLASIGMLPPNLIVTESHALDYVVQGMVDYDRLIIFDQHLDLYPIKEDSVTCENWLLWTLLERERKGKTPEVIVVIPNWANPGNLEFNLCDDSILEHFNKIKFMHFGELERSIDSFKQRIQTSFLCRSGAWCPPWADKEFARFLSSAKRYLIGIDEIPETPLLKREWDKSRAKELLDQIKKIMPDAHKKFYRRMENVN